MAYTMISRLFDRRNKPHLALGQSPGAFTLPTGGISPLYLVFEVENKGVSEVEIREIHVSPKSGARIDHPALEGDRSLPFVLEAGGTARFWVRAKALASSFKEAGYDGRSRANIVVEDALGTAYEKSFKLPVNKYLNLKDE